VCAGPVHCLLRAARLVDWRKSGPIASVAAWTAENLGTKFLAALSPAAPVLEDVRAGMAILVGRRDGTSPVIRTDAVGRHRVGSGSSQEALLTDLVVRPLESLGRRIDDIDRYATELHDPDIT